MPRRAAVLAAMATATLLAAPVLEDGIVQAAAGSATTHDFDPSLLVTSGFNVFAVLGWAASTPTFTSFAGTTDDTSAEIVSYSAARPRGTARTVNVVGAKDVTWQFTASASTRACLGGIAISGLTTMLTPVFKVGNGTAPTANAFAIPGGAKNVLAVEFMLIEGAHVTNPPVVPSGWTQVSAAATGTNSSSNERVTMVIATRIFAAVSDVPATVWSVPDGASLNNWTLRMVGHG